MALWVLAGILPLIIFVLVDIYAGPRQAIVAAIVLGLILLGANYAATRELDWSLMVEVLLVTLLGAVSLKLNDTRFFKFQPTITGVLFALFLAYYQVFDEPFMVKMAARMAKLTPEYQERLENPLMHTLFATLSWQLIILLLVHAALVAFAALRLKNGGWLAMRLAIYPMLIALTIANVALL